MKRLVLVAGALALAATGAFAAAEAEGAASDAVYDVKIFYEFSKDRLPQEYPYHAEVALDKFGLRFEYDFVAGGSTVEKTDLLFAAGDYYDMHPYGLRVWEVNRWAMDGHIVPLSDHWEDLPNYRKWWTDDEWATVEAFNAAPDGKMYMLLSKNPRTISRGFVYRQDLVEDAGLEWPTTIDGYTELLRALKANNPDHYPLFTRGQGGIFTDVFYNTWRTTAGVHFDIDSGELVYGAATDKMRELLKYFTGIYAEGLMDAEFLTNTRERENEILYVANTAITTPNWTGNVPYMNNTSRKATPEVTWTHSFIPLLSAPGAEAIVNPEQVFYPWGPFLTTNSEGEKLDRLLAYLNWIMDGEGLVARYFGEEGVEFEYQDGKPVYLPHMRTPDNPDGVQGWEIGLENYPIFHPDRPLSEGDQIYKEMTEWAVGKPFIRKIAWGFNATEEKDRADVQTVVDDTWKQYRAKFVLGELDASDDAHWQEYLDALDNAGVDRLLELYQGAYDRNY